jgi:ferric-dicitrate binding protein FerR (iron transport regulator)
VACRAALNQARAGAAPTIMRPVTPPSHNIPKFWAIAAMAALTAGLGIWAVARNFRGGGSGQAAVQTVNGILYAVADNHATPIFSGKAIADGQHIRTAKGSTAIVRLADGSLVEMNERSELSFVRASAGTTIRLGRGNIIVQAAKQRSGTLNVLTADCEVAVKGTIFAVDRGTKGSRVSVVEGSVKVSQGAQSQMLKPGEQVATDQSHSASSVPDAVSWSRDSARYLALLGEFSIIKKGLDALPAQNLRHDSKLLPYVSHEAVLYASVPNVNASLTEAERLFRARLQESPVLRQWWDEQQDNKKLEEMIARLRSFTEYLGDEIVFTIDGGWDGNYSDPMILAEVKRPGLEAFLNNELRAFALKGDKNLPEVVQLQAASDDSSNRRMSRRRASAAASDHMVIGVKDGLMAVAWNQDQLRSLAQRLSENTDMPRDNSLLGTVRQAYDRGAGWLLCVNMEQIARNTVNRNKGKRRSPLPPGLESMRYLTVESKDIAGKTENQATLSFAGQRWGMAGWLAEPSPMGSLDFVSPAATVAVSMALRSPQVMLGDLFRTLSENDPEFERRLEEVRNQSGLYITPSLAAPMGGEMTFAVDGPLLPLPSWKLVIEVYDPQKMQWTIEKFTDALNQAAARDGKCANCQVRISQDQVNGRTFYTVATDKFAYEIHYTYVDGYLVAAPSASLLTKAIQNRDTGYVLSRSEAFRSQLPRDGRMNFSAIVYHNLGTALAPLADNLGSINAIDKNQRDSIQALVSNTKPGLIYAYGEADSIMIASSSGFFGFDLSSVALPNLIGRGLHGPAMAKKQLVQ